MSAIDLLKKHMPKMDLMFTEDTAEYISDSELNKIKIIIDQAAMALLRNKNINLDIRRVEYDNHYKKIKIWYHDETYQNKKKYEGYNPLANNINIWLPLTCFRHGYDTKLYDDADWSHLKNDDVILLRVARELISNWNNWRIHSVDANRVLGYEF